MDQAWVNVITGSCLGFIDLWPRHQTVKAPRECCRVRIQKVQIGRVRAEIGPEQHRPGRRTRRYVRRGQQLVTNCRGDAAAQLEGAAWLWGIRLDTRIKSERDFKRRAGAYAVQGQPIG